jgi:hypothetical protein
MVQVDIFWSFGIGAGFAAAAARQLKDKDDPFETKYFVKTLIYLSVFFVPSGAILLWGFPEWETMQAGRYETIPAWLVGLFTVTNVTQGILGFWLAYRLIKAGNTLGAWLLCGLGYFCMFFILVHGWDGTGYQRFFYTCTNWGSLGQCVLWEAGQKDILRWAFGPVALTLYAMGLVMLPLMFYWMSDWVKSGYELGDVDKEKALHTTRMDITKIILRLVFVHILGMVITMSILIHLLSWWGLLIFVALIYFVEFGGLGLVRREINNLTLEGSGDSA